jgi:hypothetical protein
MFVHKWISITFKRYHWAAHASYCYRVSHSHGDSITNVHITFDSIKSKGGVARLSRPAFNGNKL